VNTSREGATTVIVEKPLLGPEQWLEIGVLEIYQDDLQYIDIGTIEIAPLSSEEMEYIIQSAMLDEQY